MIRRARRGEKTRSLSREIGKYRKRCDGLINFATSRSSRRNEEGKYGKGDKFETEWNTENSSKGRVFYLQPSKSQLRGTLPLKLGVAMWRRVDVSLYACRKRCPQAEERETWGWRGRRVERITNMTSILRQAGGEAITVGWDRPSPFSTLPAILTPHPRGLWTLTLSNYRSTFHPGGNACIMLREATSFDEARSCLAWNSTGGEKNFEKKEEKKKKKEREKMKRKKGEREERKGGEERRAKRLHHREFNAILTRQR